MAETKISKVRFKKSDNSLEFSTEDYLLDTLTLISAKSLLPIRQMMTFINEGLVDSVSCSRDDTNFSFFARVRRDKVSIIIKQLGEETMEFDISKKRAIEHFTPLI